MSWRSPPGPARRRAGDLKFKGKKWKDYGCGCCTAFDFRDEFNEHLADQEIIRSSLAYTESDRLDELPSLLDSLKDQDCS
jgi:hypothetical protein